MLNYKEQEHYVALEVEKNATGFINTIELL